MYLVTRGLVLRVVNYNDNDALITLLTEEHGKLSIKARGLRRKNSPLAAVCQLLAYGEFTLFEHRGFYTINEASSIELFTPLHRDLCKLSLGTYFAQVAEVLSQEDLPNPELLSLTLNCLFALSKLNEPETKVKSVFELRAACIAGYTPDLGACKHCADPYPDKFNISEGRMECTGCASYSSGCIRMPVSAGMLDAMRYICFCDSRKLFSFQISLDAFQELSYLSESYLLTQLERGFTSLDFYKSLAVPFEFNQE